MGKKDDKLEFYKKELLNYTHSVDYPLLEEIVNYLGLNVFKRDAELVSSSDKKELDRVKKSFLRGKLELKRTSDKKLNEAIQESIEIFGSSNKKKYRALFYYFLTKNFKKESVFLKWSVDDEEHINKIEKLAKEGNNKLRIKSKKRNSNKNLYLAILLNIIVIIGIMLILL